jgi:hypothetical protein
LALLGKAVQGWRCSAQQGAVQPAVVWHGAALAVQGRVWPDRRAET